jgi:hypothetical protein
MAAVTEAVSARRCAAVVTTRYEQFLKLTRELENVQR